MKEYYIGREVTTEDGIGVIDALDWNDNNFPILVKFENGSGWYAPYMIDFI